ncbi:MAG: hypothetical protein RLZZ500_1621 [Bacteroidota bacterium]|jgi:uncharacterized coiled-coil protein SlyX
MKTKKTTLVWLCLTLGAPFMFFAQTTTTTQTFNNTFYGQNSGINNSGNFSCGFGVNTLMNNGGNSNTGFGIQALMSPKGGFNAAFGASSMKNNDSGSLNSAFGTRTLENNLSGSFNVAIGHRTMGDLTEPGNMNTAIGYSALKINVGDGNIALGYFSPRHLASGNNNIFIGTETAANLERGSGNVFLGKVSVNPFASSAVQIGNDADKTIVFADGYGTQRLTISNTGNVGIGLGNNVLSSNRLEVNGGVVIGKSFVSNASPMAGFTAPSNGMLVEGRIGVGNTTPGNKVEITHGTTGFSGLRFTNLTNAFVPAAASTTRKFLTVNATGDVVLENVGTTNILSSNQNTLTSTVNGVASSAPIVNSVTTIFAENNQLTTIVNGIASTPVTIPIPTDSDAQSLTLAGNVLSISNGNSVTLPADGDSNPTNELQTLTQNGNVVTLSNGGGSFTLPTDTDTDAQTLALAGNVLSISNGNSVTLPADGDSNPTNELQTLTQNGNVVTLSNGGGTFTLPTDTDTDAQTLSLAGNVLSISNGNNVTLPQTIIHGGPNITVTGNGTSTTPYLISSLDTSIYSANGSINQATTTGPNRVVNMNSRNIWFNTSTSTVNGKIYIGNTTAYPTTTGNYRLYVEGGILTEKVKVALRSSNNWADYVFAEDYKLMPLKEVASFIQKNKHLPGVASAEQLASEGLDLAAMQAKHMEKIEELTLYVIDQDKKIETQQATLNQQQKEIENLKAQVELLIQKMK